MEKGDLISKVTNPFGGFSFDRRVNRYLEQGKWYHEGKQALKITRYFTHCVVRITHVFRYILQNFRRAHNP